MLDKVLFEKELSENLFKKYYSKKNCPKTCSKSIIRNETVQKNCTKRLFKKVQEEI